MKKIVWYGRKVKKKARKGAEKGVLEGIHYLRDEMDKKVPHDEGTLERSGDTIAKGLQAATGYDTPYAIRLHEHPEYNFQGGREGKWVEKVIKDKKIQRKVLKHIGNEIKKALR